MGVQGATALGARIHKARASGPYALAAQANKMINKFKYTNLLKRQFIEIITKAN
jgi:hypothetical protein